MTNTPLRFALTFLLWAFWSLHCAAQQVFESNSIQGFALSLSGVKFDSSNGNIHRIALKNYGLNKSNYSVIVSVILPGDSVPLHIPGHFENGNYFDFKLKGGKRSHGDTLIIRRSGNQPIVLSKINILVFRGITLGGIIPYQKAFKKFLLRGYLSPIGKKEESLSAYFSSGPPFFRQGQTD